MDKTIVVLVDDPQLRGDPSLVGVALPAGAATYRGSVSFAPMAADWPQRQALLGERAASFAQQPIPTVDEAFDWTYFGSVPPEQTGPLLRGDEWLVLEGLSPRHPVLRTQLPGAWVSVRVSLPLADGGPLPLVVRADMLRIDGERGQCSILWRGSFPVADETTIDQHSIWVTVGLPGEAQDVWPPTQGALAGSLAPELAAAQPPPATAPATSAAAPATRAAAPGLDAPPRAAPVVSAPASRSPWSQGQPATGGAPLAPPAPAPIAVHGDDPLDGTVGLSGSQHLSAGQQRAMPFAKPTGAGAAPKRVSPFAAKLGGAAPARKRVSPFAAASGGGPAQGAPPAADSFDKTVALDSLEDPLSGTVPLTSADQLSAQQRQATPFEEEAETAASTDEDEPSASPWAGSKQGPPQGGQQG